MQPGSDVAGYGAASPAATAAGLALRYILRPLLLSRGIDRQQNEDAAAQRLEEIAAVEVEAIGGSSGVQLIALRLQKGDLESGIAHRAPPLARPAPAARIAARIRGCVPQRQTLPSMARRISA